MGVHGEIMSTTHIVCAEAVKITWKKIFDDMEMKTVIEATKF